MEKSIFGWTPILVLCNWNAIHSLIVQSNVPNAPVNIRLYRSHPWQTEHWASDSEQQAGNGEMRKGDYCWSREIRMTVTGQSKSGSATSTTSSVVAFSVDDAAMDDGKRGRCSEYEIIHIFACFFGNYVCPLSHINPTVFFLFPHYMSPYLPHNHTFYM